MDAPKIEKLEEETVTLSWKAGKPEPLTYIIQSKPKDAKEWTTCKETTATTQTLDREEPECAYRIVGKNEVGKSKPTKSVTVPKKGEA